MQGRTSGGDDQTEGVEEIFQGRGRSHPDRVTKAFFWLLGCVLPSEFQEEGGSRIFEAYSSGSVYVSGLDYDNSSAMLIDRSGAAQRSF